MYNMALLCVTRIFSVQCSYSMGYVTTTIHIQDPVITPPQNSNKWVHLVNLKPQPKIQLTCSSYKSNIIFRFLTLLHGFQSVSNYLDDLWTDVNNPSYFWHLFIPFACVLIDPTINDSHIEDFLKSPACHHHPYSCQAKMKFE